MKHGVVSDDGILGMTRTILGDRSRIYGLLRHTNGCLWALQLGGEGLAALVVFLFSLKALIRRGV